MSAFTDIQRLMMLSRHRLRHISAATLPFELKSFVETLKESTILLISQICFRLHLTAVTLRIF